MTFRDWHPVFGAVPMISGRLRSRFQISKTSSTVYFYSPDPRQHDTGYLFVSGSWRIRATYPSKHFVTLQEQ